MMEGLPNAICITTGFVDVRSGLSGPDRKTLSYARFTTDCRPWLFYINKYRATARLMSAVISGINYCISKNTVMHSKGKLLQLTRAVAFKSAA